MTRRLLFLFLLILAVSPALFAQTFTATLAGAAEVPGPGDTDGTGFAVVTFSGTTMTYSIITTGLAPITGAHIHRGATGEAPPSNIVVGFTATPVGGLIAGSQTVTQDVINLIVANPAGHYVNVHTGDFPGGAIRGQLAGTPSGEGARVSYLPISGKGQGAGGTNFVTDLRIVNETNATANVTLDFFAASTTGQTGPNATRTLTVAAGEQEVVDDVIAFLSTTGNGAIRITSDQNVTAIARIIDDQRANQRGTAGYATTSLELSEARKSGTLPFLATSSIADIGAGVGFRTNLGYFNPTATPVSLTLVARRTTDGTVIGSQTLAVPAYGQIQQGAFVMITGVGAADQIQQNFYVTWSSSSSMFVFATVIDNKSGDAVLIY